MSSTATEKWSKQPWSTWYDRRTEEPAPGGGGGGEGAGRGGGRGRAGGGGRAGRGRGRAGRGEGEGGAGRGRGGRGEARSQLLEKGPSLLDARKRESRCVGTLQRKKGQEGT